MEQYTAIESFPNYEVSNLGNVRNTKNNNIIKSCVGSNGYGVVSLYRFGDGYTMATHKLVAKYYVPNPNGGDIVDHIDGNKENNCADNLRWCTRSQNAMNSKISSTNKTGVKGVSQFNGKYYAKITVDGVQRSLGTYSSLDEAKAARQGASALLFGQFAHPCEVDA